MAKPNARRRSAAAHRFRALVHQAVTPDDVLAICRMLAGSARQGNVIAAKLLFNYLGGTPSALPPAPVTAGGVRIYLPAMDEEPLESAPPPEPGRTAD
jgi:hypothetical protein